ncbi:hypothetical protein RQP46_006919 [Phenoliferia psychrophenolica]
MHVVAPTLLISLAFGAGANAVTLHGRAKRAGPLPDGTFDRQRYIKEADAVSKKYSAIHDLLAGVPLVGDLANSVVGDLLGRRELGVVEGRGLVGDLLGNLGLGGPDVLPEDVDRDPPRGHLERRRRRAVEQRRAGAVLEQQCRSYPHFLFDFLFLLFHPLIVLFHPLIVLVIRGREDIEYYGPVSVGTPGQIMNIDFDTGSADLWVPEKSAGNTDAPFFAPSKSSTFDNTGEAFEITYGLGNVKGTRATDVVSVAGLAVPAQAFGAITEESDEFKNDAVSGILGLGFASIATAGVPFFDNLISAGALLENLFTFYMTRGVVTGSVLSLGVIPTDHYSGDIVYTPVTSETYWEVSMPTIRVEGAAVPMTASAAIDTGTTLIYLPGSVAAAMWAQVPGAEKDVADSSSTSTFYQFPCQNKPSIAFVFGGNTIGYTITPDDINFGTATGSTTMCVGSIVGQEIQGSSSNQIAIIGDAFLKNVFTVFHRNGTADGGPAVGFATVVA